MIQQFYKLIPGILLKCLALVTILCPAFLYAQINDANLLRELLDLPSPPPVFESEDNKEIDLKQHAQSIDEKDIPSDDAPIEELCAYWTIQSDIAHWEETEGIPRPSKRSVSRLLTECPESFSELSGLLKLLPKTPEMAETVKEIFDQLQTDDEIGNNRREPIRKWLKFNSRYYLDELTAEASLARDETEYAWVFRKEELEAFADIAPEEAKPLLKKLVTNPDNPRTTALAKALLYEIAISTDTDGETEKYRDELKMILTDRNALPFARNAASDALFKTQWRGRDDFYLSLMEDASLLYPVEDGLAYSPLSSLPTEDPDKWIPILAELVNSPKRAVHNAAVQSLMQFEDRKDAIEPLLPWLTDPDWADISWDPGGRITLMQLVSDVDLPKSIPGLIWIVENDGINARWAAGSLAEFKDPRAVPALKKALNRFDYEYDRYRIIEALIDCGGLSTEEQLATLELYAEYASKPENREKIQDFNPYSDETPLSVDISIGRFLSRQEEPTEDLIRRVFERQKDLREENPDLARFFSDIMTRWQGRLVDLEMLRKIDTGEADVETVLGALARREDLRKNVATELYALRGKRSPAAGFAACILEDENEILTIFSHPDGEIKISVMACARLIRAKLPVHEVVKFLESNNRLLALAAERYLVSEDSPEARNLVLDRYPGEAMILGARTSFNPTKTTRFPDSLKHLFTSTIDWYTTALYPDESAFVSLDSFEDELRQEILNDENLLEIYSIVPTYVIRIFKDRAVFTWYEDKTRFRQKILTPEELVEFRNSINESEIEETPPLFGDCHYDCGMLEYVRITRNGGRRFFAYTDFTRLIGIQILFQNLGESEETELRYYLQDNIEGLEVLWADNNLQPRIVWKKGEDLRLLMEDDQKRWQILEEINEQDRLDRENISLDYSEKSERSHSRRDKRQYEHYSWQSFENGKLGGIVEEPSEIPYFADKAAFPPIDYLNSNDSIWQARYNDFEIRTGNTYDTYGLWKVNRTESFRIATGWFGEDVFVMGDWAVSAKTDEHWSVPNYVVRINLKTDEEYKINLPPADNFEPVALVPAHNKVLLWRASDKRTEKITNNPSPMIPEFYLLDVFSGTTEKVNGQFHPLIQQTYRPLQPTGKPNEYWAALYDEKQNATEIGRYNAYDFSFDPALSIPEIELDSMDIWVDEEEAKVYFVYQSFSVGESHLLSLPLPVK